MHLGPGLDLPFGRKIGEPVHMSGGQVCAEAWPGRFTANLATIQIFSPRSCQKPASSSTFAAWPSTGGSADELGGADLTNGADLLRRAGYGAPGLALNPGAG